MEFVELNEKEYREYSLKHELLSFFQTVENAELRKIYGARVVYLGVKDKKKILCAGMFTFTPCMFGKYRFTSPQGILMDYHDLDLLKFFTDNLVKYAKKNKVMFIKLEPNVIYQIRDVNGDLIDGNYRDDLSIDNLKKCGYKHFGFTKDYRFSQSRWNFRLELDTDYDSLKKRFSKSTRKNIDNMYSRGVRIERGDYDSLERMTYLLQATADRKGFMHRTLDYYKNMYKTYNNLMHIYIAYVDTDIYFNHITTSLEDERKNNLSILDKMKHDMVGSRLKNMLEVSNKRIEKLEEELVYATKLKEMGPKIDVGGLLSIESGNEYVTLTSGILEEYKSFMPKYIMYNEHILDAYKLGFRYVNFYGISGVFNKSSAIYGVYEFKKGWTGNVIELIGEFTYKISNTYYIYNLFRHMKIAYRKIRKK